MFDMSKDDIFLLGNIGLSAIIAGYGDEVMPLLDVVKSERPLNAGGFIAEALHLYAKGETEAAVALLEETTALRADVNLDEALAFHLFLLHRTGAAEKVLALGESYLAERLVTSPQAVATIEEIVSLVRADVAFHDYRQAAL